MRFVLPASLLLIAFGACSSHSSSATNYTASDGGGADDGSTAACTSVGGTCEAYSAGCPIVQQNPELCGDVLLVCCLPPGGETVAGPDAGAEPTDAGVTMPLPDAGETMPPPDAGETKPPPDAGETKPPADAGSGPPEDDAAVDAPSE